LISKFFEEIAQDTNKYCFGIRDALYSLEGSAVHTLILYENLDMDRYEVTSEGVTKVLYYTKEQASVPGAFKDPSTQKDYEVQEKVQVVEWMAENYKKYGCSLSFVTDRSQEGAQFVRGFGGVGCLLRWPLDLTGVEVGEEAPQDNDEDYDFLY